MKKGERIDTAWGKRVIVLVEHDYGPFRDVCYHLDNGCKLVKPVLRKTSAGVA